MNTEIMYPDVTVQLTGQDGNAFAIMGTIAKAIRAARGTEEADQWIFRATECGSYDELLVLAQTTVHVI